MFQRVDRSPLGPSSRRRDGSKPDITNLFTLASSTKRRGRERPGYWGRGRFVMWSFGSPAGVRAMVGIASAQDV